MTLYWGRELKRVEFPDTIYQHSAIFKIPFRSVSFFSFSINQIIEFSQTRIRFFYLISPKFHLITFGSFMVLNNFIISLYLPIMRLKNTIFSLNQIYWDPIQINSPSKINLSILFAMKSNFNYISRNSVAFPDENLLPRTSALSECML